MDRCANVTVEAITFDSPHFQTQTQTVQGARVHYNEPSAFAYSFIQLFLQFVVSAHYCTFACQSIFIQLEFIHTEEPRMHI